MRIRPLTEIGANRALCLTTIRIAAGASTYESQRQISKRDRLGIPHDQCGQRGDFVIDGAVTCRSHAGAAALAFVLEHHRERTDAEEIVRPRCGCDSATVRRVLIEHGTCAMGGCPYGGDV